MNLEAILDDVRSAARLGAGVACAGFRKHPDVEHKGACDLVTAYDRESESVIRQRLAASYPYAIIGEEQGGQAADVAFYVDPIDGTTNFVHGHPFWCVSIGLVVSGAPVLGVVLAPALGIEWYGWTETKGAITTRHAYRRSAQNGILDGQTKEPVVEPCVVSGLGTFEESLLATGFPYDRKTSAENNFDAFVAIKKRCQAVRRCGSAALDLCLVADGTYEGYWERKLKPWDIAAGIAIVEAARGKVTDFDGGPTSIETGMVIATNGAIHEELRLELSLVDGR